MSMIGPVQSRCHEGSPVGNIVFFIFCAIKLMMMMMMMMMMMILMMMMMILFTVNCNCFNEQINDDVKSIYLHTYLFTYL